MEEFTEEVTTTSYNTYSDIEGDYDDGYNEGDEEDDERSHSAIGMFMSNAKLLRGHKTPLPEFGSNIFDGTGNTNIKRLPTNFRSDVKYIKFFIDRHSK